jgi:hypothetical protein
MHSLMTCTRDRLTTPYCLWFGVQENSGWIFILIPHVKKTVAFVPDNSCKYKSARGCTDQKTVYIED